MFGKRIYSGISVTPTGNSWRAMMNRCYQTSQGSVFARYGARGIKVCEYLQRTPLNLVVLIGPRPHGKTLDRKDNLRHYSCGDCVECLRNGWTMNLRWSTPAEQQRNMRSNHLVTIDDETRCLTEWAEKAGLSAICLHYRLARGESGKDLLRPSEKRPLTKLTIGGKTKTVSQWSSIANLSPSTIYRRLLRGVPTSQILS